jgi:hypothetical protein
MENHSSEVSARLPRPGIENRPRVYFYIGDSKKRNTPNSNKPFRHSGFLLPGLTNDDEPINPRFVGFLIKWIVLSAALM